MLNRGAELEGERFGLLSLLAMLEDQASIPVELRGRIVIVCETVFVDWFNRRHLACVSWDNGQQGWVVCVFWVGNVWFNIARLARLGK